MSALASVARGSKPARVVEHVPPGTVAKSTLPDSAGPARSSGSPAISARVSTLLTPRVQLQLRVSSPADPAEREAEATAKKIMRMPAPPTHAVATAAGGGRSEALRTGTPPVVNLKRNSSTLLRAPPVGRLHTAPLAIQRQAKGPRVAGDDVTQEIRSSLAGGEPLPRSVLSFMQPRFRASFADVRIHTGKRAAGLAARLSARAFTYGRHIFFGKDQYRPSDPDGQELIAHELTHTIQQREVVQRQEVVTVDQRESQQVQRLGFDDILDWVADKANLIPGFRMFTIVLGVNPVNMSRVERSAANVLRAVVEFIPGGNLITRALDTYGIFDKVGTWVERQLRTLGMVGSSIKRALSAFIDSLGLRDLLRPGNVWERAKRIFTEPIDRIKSFVAGFITGILDFLREAVLRPLARLAEGTRAYDLLKAVLGKDPITGDPVPQNADVLIGGFMKLIGQEEVYNNIKRGNAVARAFAWFRGALGGVLAFVRAVPGLIVSTLRSITLADFLPITNLFAKVGRAFAGFVGSFISWALNQVLELLKIIFEVVAPRVMPYVRKAAGAFTQIVRNPIGFIRNLVRAGILGFRQFAGRFLSHLRTALIQWLTGTMSGANIYIPQAFSLREIIKFVLSVLGLTWQNIRQRLVRVIGETPVRAMEAGFDIVRTLVTQGPAAAWDKIREGVSNLQQMVMGQVMAFVRTRIVQAAITRLVTSLNPAGAFIQAIIAIYNTVMFFVERMRQIAQVAASFIDSISAIASGAVGAAANRVERTMAGLLVLVISFLARIVGLGSVSTVVVNIVNRIRAPINRALDRVVTWIVAQARRLGSFFGGRDARSPAEKLQDLQRAARELRPRIRELFRRGPPGRLFGVRVAAWRRQYRLSALSVQRSGAVVATINPTLTIDQLVAASSQATLAIIQDEVVKFFAPSRTSPTAATVQSTGAGARLSPFVPAAVGSVAQGVRAVLTAPGGAPRETSWVMGTHGGRPVIAILQRTAAPSPGQGEVFMFDPATGRRVKIGAYHRSREIPGVPGRPAPTPTGPTAATRIAAPFGGSGSLVTGSAEELAIEGRLPTTRTAQQVHAAAGLVLMGEVEAVRQSLAAVAGPSALERTTRSGVAPGTTLAETMGGAQAARGSADDARLAQHALSRFDLQTGSLGPATIPDPHPRGVRDPSRPGSEQRAAGQMIATIDALSNTILQDMVSDGVVLITGPSDYERIRERTRAFLRQRHPGHR